MTGAELLREARALESAGRLPEAMECYERAVAQAEKSGEWGILSEALNTLGGLDLSGGSLDDARRTFLEALELGGTSRQLRARVEQNLGILANIRGELDEAMAHYGKSLDPYRSAEDRHGCALAYHNLGMVSADREELEEADRYFRQSRNLATQTGDQFLQGLCLVNHSEVDLARQRYENARQDAEAALELFDRLGARAATSDAHRVIGMVYRETGRPEQAEARLREAIGTAEATRGTLSEAEASHELALHFQALGRNRDALGMLNRAHGLFRRLDARLELVRVGGKMAQLEATYRMVVRDWGRSLESRDSDTFGHSERVAGRALAIARLLGLEPQEETAVLLGASLHDLGKLRVPREILNRRGPLTGPELALVRNHPRWGLEMLSGLEFPWDLKPIIGSHHEHYDGSGYPDGLRGEEIPLTAQIVGIAEVYDALTTMWAGGPPLDSRRAIERMNRLRSWWSERVFAALLVAIDQPSPGEAGACSSDRRRHH